MGVYRANVNITCSGMSPAVNVWHLRTDTSAEDTAGKAMAQDALDKIRAFYFTIAGHFMTGSLFKCDGITDVDSDVGVTLNWSNVSGTSASSLLAPALAVCVGWKTSIRARRGMGRTFLSPFTGLLNEADGTISPGPLATINTAAGALVTASLLDNGWAVGVYGQQNAMGKATSEERQAAPHVLRDFVGYKINDKFAVMRSRRP